jgi:hypothetical protein
LSKAVAQKKQCVHCGKEQHISKAFYASDNPLDKDGRINMCKDCIKNNINYDDINTVKNILYTINKPFIYDTWESAIEESKNPKGINTDPFGCYMKTLALNYRGKGLTWKDSVENSLVNSNANTIDNKSKEEKFEITDAIYEKWGEGYTPEHYRLFEKKYARLIRNYGEKTEFHVEGLCTYIRFRVCEEMASAKGDVKEAKEWASLAKDAASAAKINVNQLSKSDISGGVDVLSQLFEAVETEASIIPLLPKLLEQPYDDADIVIWSNINYYRTLEDKPRVNYREIWQFYDQMLNEHFQQQGFDEKQIIEFKKKRNNVFRDLGEVYIEPLYGERGD